jgi:hypothetical protein
MAGAVEPIGMEVATIVLLWVLALLYQPHTISNHLE